MKRLSVQLSFLGALLCVACTHDPYVWVTEIPPQEAAPASTYLIEPGDVLDIRVWEQDNMTSKARVRADGRIYFPLLNELVAAGKQPTAFAREIEDALRTRKFLNDPHVLVNVDAERPTMVSVFGEVAHPGTISVGDDAGVLQAILGAGGLTDFADRDSVYVIRKGLKPSRIRFRFRDLTQVDGPAAQFRLRNEDIVQVE